MKLFGKKDKMAKLPDKAWQLLQLSLDAIEMLEHDPRYLITTELEYNMFHSYVHEMNKTLVNFSGALMTIYNDLERTQTVSPTEYERGIHDKLLSIDLMSNFEVYHALELLYRDTYLLQKCKIVSDMVHFDDNVFYDQNSIKYKVRIEFIIMQLKTLDL